MADTVQNVKFFRIQILDFTNFNVISWLFMIKIKVSMYFPYISQATGLLPVLGVLGFVRLSVLTGSLIGV